MPYTANPVWGFSPDWAEKVVEKLLWKTDVLTSEIGAEQRISRRLTPRRTIEASFHAVREDRQYFDNIIGAKGAGNWAVPLWYQVAHTTAAANIGTSTIPVDTINREYKPGGLAMLRGSHPWQWEVVTILSVGVGSLVLAAPLEATWPARTRVYPGVIARLSENSTQGDRRTDEYVVWRSQFTLTDFNPSPSDWIPPNTYQSVPVLDIRPDENEELTSEHSRLMDVIDNDCGIPLHFDMGGKPFRRFRYMWFYVGRTKADEFRRAMYYLRGRTKTIWVPTFMQDFTLAGSVSSGASTITVVNSGFARLAVLGEGRRDIRIELRDGTIFYRRITTAVETNASIDTLTLNATLTQAFTPSDVISISFLVPARLDDDTVEIVHYTDADGMTLVDLTWKQVPDPV